MERIAVFSLVTSHHRATVSATPRRHLQRRQTDQTAQCLVDADAFGATVCDSPFMERYCSSGSCPTLLACGESCPDGSADAGPTQSDQWVVTAVPAQD